MVEPILDHQETLDTQEVQDGPAGLSLSRHRPPVHRKVRRPTLYLLPLPKPKEHIAFCLEPDGSLCLLLIPRDFRKWDKDEPVPTLGHIRRDPGGFLSTRDFPELPDYVDWERHPTAEEAIQHLVREADAATSADIASAQDSGPGDPDDEDHRALEALEAIRFPDESLSRKTAGMLVAAARQRVVSAVADMLLVASYDEAIAAVNQAVLKEVLTS